MGPAWAYSLGPALVPPLVPPLAKVLAGASGTASAPPLAAALDEVSAEVGLLTRMIKVRGPSSADKDGFGGHAGVFQTATPQTIDGVELVRLGQQGLVGRYPMHLHLSLNHSGTVIRRNSVRDSYQRCIVVHGTTDAVVEDNVAFRGRVELGLGVG